MTRTGSARLEGSARPEIASEAVVHWLLEKDQPAVRALALVNLLERRENDPEVRRARSRIGAVGWAADQLRRQRPQGYWERREPKNFSEWVEFLYNPVYGSTNWRALVLAELGMDSSDARIRKLAGLIFDYKLRLSSPFNFFHEEVCIAGNTARMMTRFGYGDDRRVRKLFDWLIEDQRPDGGWNCSQGTPGTLDAWEALAAFAVVPRSKRSTAMNDAVAKGVEFYLERRLIHEGRRYPPWLRLHYPTHYYYDFLIGLDLVTQLGDPRDPRLRPALDLLRSKRNPDGTWNLEATHPDLGPGVKISTDDARITPLVIERPGRPSKWITLKALTVLKRTNAGR
ncbi:MAG TPA: hypothetical protein VFF67_04385 [Thermoplasmata archaeon]|nr:hypothetical protein [Thermoplasmata archaeon]